MGGLFKRPKAPKIKMPTQRMPTLNQESEEEKRRREAMAKAMAEGRESTRLVRNTGRKAGTMGA